MHGKYHLNYNILKPTRLVDDGGLVRTHVCIDIDMVTNTWVL